MSAWHSRKKKIQTKWKSGNKEKISNKNEQPTPFGTSCAVMFIIRGMSHVSSCINAQLSYKHDELASSDHRE